MKPPRCADCKLFVQKYQDDLDPSKMGGECRARPPVADPHHEPVVWPDESASAQPMFVMVTGNDWCAAFKRREI